MEIPAPDQLYGWSDLNQFWDGVTAILFFFTDSTAIPDHYIRFGTSYGVANGPEIRNLLFFEIFVFFSLNLSPQGDDFQWIFVNFRKFWSLWLKIFRKKLEKSEK